MNFEARSSDNFVDSGGMIQDDHIRAKSSNQFVAEFDDGATPF